MIEIEWSIGRESRYDGLSFDGNDKFLVYLSIEGFSIGLRSGLYPIMIDHYMRKSVTGL